MEMSMYNKNLCREFIIIYNILWNHLCDFLMEEVFSVPNIKSAKKRVLLSRASNERNKAAKSALKTTIKKFDAAVVSGNREEAAAAYTNAVKAIDKAVNKGILHKNNAARKKSSLTLKLNAMA